MRPRLVRLVAAALTAAALAAGCGRLGTEPSPGEHDDALAVTAQSDALRLENLTDATLFYLASDPTSLALIDLNPCTSVPQTCTNLVPARGTRTVPLDQVIGVSASTREVSIMHWHVVPRAGGGGNEVRGFSTLTVQVR